jgi:anti-sigma factor RsiW
MSEKNWQRELTAYIDGELPEAERRELEAALATDPQLRALEMRLRQTIALMQRVPATAPSPRLKSKVLSSLDAEPTSSRAWAWQKLVPAVALAAAAVIAVVLLRGGGGREEAISTFVEADQVLLAQNIDVVEDLDLDGLATFEDLDVIEQLAELEKKP